MSESENLKRLLPTWLLPVIILAILFIVGAGGVLYYWDDLSSWFESGGGLSVNNVDNNNSSVFSNNGDNVNCGYDTIRECVNKHKPFPPGLTIKDYEWSCEHVLKCKKP